MAKQAMAQGSEGVDYYDRDPQRRAAARLLGCEVFSEMPDVDRHYPFVIFTSINPAELEPAVRAMAPGGHMQMLTLFFGGPVTVNLWEMFMRDVTLAVGVPNSKPHIPAVLEQVRCGHIHPERLITVHDWTEVPEALYSSDIKPVVVRPTVVNPSFATSGV